MVASHKCTVIERARTHLTHTPRSTFVRSLSHIHNHGLLDRGRSTDIVRVVVVTPDL